MPVTKFSIPEKYEYQNGFGSYHEYELSLHTDSFRTQIIVDPKL